MVFFLDTAVLGSLGSFVSCSEVNSGSLLKRLAFTDIREYGYLVYKIRPEMKSKSEIREMLIYSVFNKRYLPPIIFINSADDIRLQPDGIKNKSSETGCLRTSLALKFIFIPD